jgi:ArsR family transcriptional regulator
LSSELATSAAEIFKAMGHPSRLILIDALRDGERCVCELAPLVPGNLSTVSRHLSQLKHAGLVDDRREGQRIYYRLTLPCTADFLSCVAAGTRG